MMCNLLNISIQSSITFQYIKSPSNMQTVIVLYKSRYFILTLQINTYLAVGKRFIPNRITNTHNLLEYFS